MRQQETANSDVKVKVRQPPVLFDKTQSLISRINKLIGAKLITY
jgi:hypothetical protein